MKAIIIKTNGKREEREISKEVFLLHPDQLAHYARKRKWRAILPAK